MNSLMGVALDAAARDWHVFPLRRFSKRPALHHEDRCPGTGACAGGHRKWEQRATTDPDRIRRAWAEKPFNVGIATGPSGLVVVDLDVPKTKSSADTPSGVTNFRALCERAGQPFPTTYETRTAGGGIHLYFTAPPGIRLGNTAGKLGQYIDTRAWGGYVVAAGSITATSSYTITDPTPPVPLPAWLLDALKPPRRKAPAPAVPLATRAPRYAAAALRNERANVANAPEGTRNTTLLRAARALGRLVASGDLDRMEVEEALSGAAMAVGSESQRYYDDVINRALNWSIANNPTSRGEAA